MQTIPRTQAAAPAAAPGFSPIIRANPPPIGDHGLAGDSESNQSHQLFLLAGRAYGDLLPALIRAGLDPRKCPSLAAVSQRLTQQTGWSLHPTDTWLPFSAFLGHLAEMRLPVFSVLRSGERLDGGPSPDLFHDLFGYVPLLANPAIREFLVGLGLLGRRFPDGQAKLRNVFSHLIEYGMVLEEGLPRVYGVRLLTSLGELNYCLGTLPRREQLPRLGGVQALLATKPRGPGERLPERYFVLPGFGRLPTLLTEMEANLWAA
jgi:phenylalanine-4-hydroxylase